MAFYNVDGDDVEVKTPILANLLPFIGFAIGAGISYKTTKSIKKSALWGLGIGALFTLPKLLLTKKALEQVKKEKKDIRSKVKDEREEVLIDEKKPITSESIYSVVELIAEKNGTMDKLLPKKDYILSVFDSFSQTQKGAALDYFDIVLSLPKNANKEDLERFMAALADLETENGKDVIDSINSRMNEIYQEIYQQDVSINENIAA